MQNISNERYMQLFNTHSYDEIASILDISRTRAINIANSLTEKELIDMSDKDERIITWYQHGISSKEIAQRLNMPTSNTIRYIIELNQAGRLDLNDDDEQLKSVIHKYSEGKSYKQMAKELGINISKLTYLISLLRHAGLITNYMSGKSSNIPPDDSTTTKQDFFEHKQLPFWNTISEDFPFENLSKDLGISESVLRQRIHRIKISSNIESIIDDRTIVNRFILAILYNNLQLAKDLLNFYTEESDLTIEQEYSFSQLQKYLQRKISSRKKNNTILRDKAISVRKNGYKSDEVHDLINLYLARNMLQEILLLLDAYEVAHATSISIEKRRTIGKIRSVISSKVQQNQKTKTNKRTVHSIDE